MARKSDERHAKALEMHLGGASYDHIAKALGYRDKSGARKAVVAILAKHQNAALSTDEVTTELARLDAMQMSLWPNARRGDVAAVDRVLKIMERRAALKAASRAHEGPATAPVTPLDEFRQRLAERDDRA